jgi:type II restriction enzyme
MSNFPQIIHQYKIDTESVYNTWFVDNDRRLKAFRTIRRGVLQVIEDIKNKTFPNDLEAIAELCFKSRTQKILLGNI